MPYVKNMYFQKLKSADKTHLNYFSLQFVYEESVQIVFCFFYQTKTKLLFVTYFYFSLHSNLNMLFLCSTNACQYVVFTLSKIILLVVGKHTLLNIQVVVQQVGVFNVHVILLLDQVLLSKLNDKCRVYGLVSIDYSVVVVLRPGLLKKYQNMKKEYTKSNYINKC